MVWISVPDGGSIQVPANDPRVRQPGVRSSPGKPHPKKPRLLSGSGVVAGTSRDQAGDEGVKQGFAASARVVHELKEAEIKVQLVLRDAPMRAQPGAQQ